MLTPSFLTTVRHDTVKETKLNIPQPLSILRRAKKHQAKFLMQDLKPAALATQDIRCMLVSQTTTTLLVTTVPHNMVVVLLPAAEKKLRLPHSSLQLVMTRSRRKNSTLHVRMGTHAPAPLVLYT